MYERLDDLGIDFSVVYPTAGLSYHRMQDTRLRRAICRAYNVFTADQFRDLSDRIIPAAIIPMYTPDEAIEEIEFAVRQLGYKVIMVGGLMRRPVPALAEERPDAASLVEWYDVIGLDSDYDYDPVWEKCRELRIAPSFHNGGRSILLRNSPSNFCFNDIGHFDVPDMAEVVPEAYELVEHGLLTDDDFRDFMFANAVRFWGEVNPDFFRGTVVEKAAADVLGNGR
jgi:predicted TIM-barrel fold metal-dependent hydrolase